MRTQSATIEKLIAVMNKRHYWNIEELVSEFGYSLATTRKLLAIAIEDRQVVAEKYVGKRTLRYWLAEIYRGKIAARKVYMNRTTSGVVEWNPPKGFDPYIR